MSCRLPSSIRILSRFIALGVELPEDAVAATGVMLSMRPKPGRIEAAAAATGADGAGADCGAVTTAGAGGVAGGTTTMGAGSRCAHAESKAAAAMDSGRIRNLLISSLLGEISCRERSSNLRTALSAALLVLCAFSARADDMDQDLIAAAGKGDLARISALLKQRANVNGRDAQGRTPVMAATYGRHAGAVVNQRDQMLNNPFLYAGAEGLLDIVKLAAAAGADPRLTNRYGGTALIPAAERGHVEVVDWLLDNTKVEVHHVTRLGWTALLEAIVLSARGPRHRRIVASLIRHGADVNLPDREGRTPLYHARSRGYAEIGALLEAAGARP